MGKKHKGRGCIKVALKMVLNVSQAIRPRERKIAVKVRYKKTNRKVFFSCWMDDVRLALATCQHVKSFGIFFALF